MGKNKMPIVIKEYMLPSIIAITMGVSGSAGWNIVVDQRPNPHTSHDDNLARAQDKQWVRNYVRENHSFTQESSQRLARIEIKQDSMETKQDNIFYEVNRLKTLLQLFIHERNSKGSNHD